MSEAVPSVQIVRRLKATPARVFAAITQPDQIILWWGPDAGQTISADNDLRPGGRYSIVFRTLDGAEHNPRGRYLEIIPEEKLVFTWEWPGHPEWESRVTFELRPIKIGTELTLIHERLPDADAVASHTAGWSGWFDELQAFFQSAPGDA